MFSVLAIGMGIAQAQSYEGKPIVAIEYDPANQPLAPEDMKAAQPLKIGQPLHKEDLESAIDKLFATGRYDDIQTDVQPRGNGVAVRFLTKSKSSSATSARRERSTRRRIVGK